MKKEVIKITLFDNKRVIIENYDRLKNLSKELIIIDKYYINGSDLRLHKMDELIIEIIGNIISVIVEEDNV